MMKNFRTIICKVHCLLLNKDYALLPLLLIFLGSITLHAYDARINGICYNLSGNEAEVTYYSDYQWSYSGYFGSVVIPKTVTYNGNTYSVTSIGDDAFSYCTSLTSINIPNSVTSIGDGAFWGCSGLTSINIPNSVTTIGSCAFGDCSNLPSITIPESMTSIGKQTFSYWDGLKSISIPNSVKSIEEYAFFGCTGLTSITIPNSVTSIDNGAFENCI